MGWMRCVGCEKLQRDIEARSFALIAPVQYVLHQLSWTYETIPNAHKYNKTHQNISLGSNGVDWVRSLQKIQMWHRGTNFCISCTCTVCFATSFMQLRNYANYSQILWNAHFVGRAFVLIAPVQYVLHQLSCSYEMIRTAPNTTKHNETLV